MLDKLTLVRPLGAGGFGRVQLMRHAPTRRVYALKATNPLHLPRALTLALPKQVAWRAH